AAFVLLLLGAAALISIGITRIRSQDEGMLAYRVGVNQVNIDLIALQSGLRGFISTGDDLILNDYTALADKVSAELQFLNVDAPFPEQMARLQADHGRWMSEYNVPVIAAVQRGDPAEAARLSEAGEPLFNQILANATDQRLLLRDRSQRIRDRIGLLNWVQLGNVLLLTLLITTSSLALVRFWHRERELLADLQRTTADLEASNADFRAITDQQGRVNAQLQGRIDESRLINSLNDLVAKEHDAASVYRLVVRHVGEFLGGWCSLSLRKPPPDSHLLSVPAVYHPDSRREAIIREWINSQEVPVDSGLHAPLFTSEDSVVLLQVPAEVSHPTDVPPELEPIVDVINLTSYIAVGIRVQNEVIGALSVASSTDGKYFDAAQELFLTQVADRVASWIENHRLMLLAEQRAAELQTSFDSISDIIAIYDSQGRQIRLNKAGRLFLGEATLDALAPELVWRNPNGAVLTPEEHPVQKALHGESVVDVELAIPRWDNQLVVHTLAVAPLRTGDHIGGVVLVARDITARKELERLKEELVANMSHELRTPLTAILGYSELLLKRRAEILTPWHVSKIEGIRTGGQRLLALVNDLLDIAKLDAGHVELHRKVIDVNRLIQAQIDILRPMLAEKNHQILLELSPDLPLVNADPDRITQVLMNLLSNAIKFTPNGGQICVSTAEVAVDERGALVRPERTGLAGLPPLESGRYLAFQVSDTGVGIAPETLPHLWDRFYQAEGGTARRFGGTGLGLSIVSQLVELHGGKAWASSPGIDQGSTFTLVLPALQAEHSPAPSGGDRSILVIESDPALARQYEEHLERAGYKTVVKRSAAEGLDWAAANQPSAITLDLLLPDSGGWEILSALRRLPHLGDVPVVVAQTADESAPAADAGLGVSTYLIKPLTGDDLLRVIQQLIGPTARTSSYVLIVDDDVDMAELVGVTLQEHGYLTRTASDGSIALDLLRTNELPSLIVLDLMMPIVDGFQLLARLRDEARTASIPVIILTARDLNREEVAQLRRAAQGIQTKHSLNMGRFVAEVQRHVALKEEGIDD
ncbi:MAG TPA: response regulator, partial [Herpetosiphonaceae bacterium]|nr:response regulator [Herpetosiphonaceae bacterium]